MAAGDVEIVVLEERRRGQHDVGHLRRFGEELLMDADEEIVAREALAHLEMLGGHHHRVGVLHEHGGDRRAVAEIGGIAGEHRTDARHVELAHA